MAVTYGTTDRCTGGTATADSYTGSQFPSLAFDDNNGTYWTTTGTFPHWIKYAFAAGVTWKISKVTIQPIVDYGILNFTINGSNNDSDYTQLYSGTCANNSDVQIFTFTNRTAYRYIKINATSGSNNETATSEIQMFEGIYPPVGGLGIGNPYIF